MTFFPEINYSLDKYENMDMIVCNFEKCDTTMVSSEKVRYFDVDFGKDNEECGTLLYNEYGICIKTDDGCTQRIPKDKYTYYKIKYLNSSKLSVTIDDMNYTFSNREDFDKFLEFINYFNDRLEIFLDKAIDKINKVYCKYHPDFLPAKIDSEIERILDELPHNYHIDDDYINYFIMLHYLTFSSDIVRRFVNFTVDDTVKAFEILKNDQEYTSEINEVMGKLFNAAQTLTDVVKLPDEYMNFYLYLTITGILKEDYSFRWLIGFAPKWGSKGELADDQNYTEYIEYLINTKPYILSCEGNAIISLAFYCLQSANNLQGDVRFIVDEIQHILENKTQIPSVPTITIMNENDECYSDSSSSHSIETASNAFVQLNNLIGLAAIKKDVNNMINLVKMQTVRKQQGLKTVPVSMHLVFTGNPGTGKTTIARILAEVYKEIGILSKGHLIEVDRSGLVAGYVGQTAIKTQEKINEALGGILFIDEAYTLAKDGQDFGQEAIDTLLKAMEDNREDFIVIVAGYSDLMQDFINSNPGLKSRFNKYIDFPDYSASELIDIFYSMCNEYQYTLSPDADGILKDKICYMESNKGPNFANARDVRNLFEMVITNQATRLAQGSYENITEIESCDFV